MRFHFFHAADIHLDRSLNGLRDSEATAGYELAPRMAFAALVDEAIRTSAAFIVLPGDIYDGAWKDSTTGLFFNAQMGRLGEVGIPAYVLYGNHDALSAMPKTVHPPENVFVFGAAAAHTFRLDKFNVALHGQSFSQADVRDNLAGGYPAPIPGYFNIGLLHTALDGAIGHAPYAPCTLEQLRGRGYDYWALGHVHTAKVLCEDPWVVFPGNLQALHVNEPGPRSATQVTVEDGRIVALERICVDVLRWGSISLDLAGVTDLSAAWVRVAQAIREALKAAEGRHLCLRVNLVGTTPLHAWLQVHTGQVEDEVLAQAAAIGDQVSIERIRVLTQDPAGASPIDHGDALGDLQAYINEAPHDPDFLAAVKEALLPVVLELSETDKETHPLVVQVREGLVDALVEAKKNELLYRIREN